MAFVNQLTRRGFASSSSLTAKIHEVVIIGGGLMGAGIAQVWSVHLAEFRGGGTLGFTLIGELTFFLILLAISMSSFGISG
jgi:hypothetical protein